MKKYISLLSLFAFFTSFVPSAHAVTFPDVQPGYIHFEAIENLFDLGVVTGNPDGNFYPNRSVNRAEMLMLLYRATNRMPNPNAVDCFSDVPSGAWFEGVVCDAASQEFVQGYDDGTFRPEREVSRIEAVKMIVEVFNLPPVVTPAVVYPVGTTIPPYVDLFRGEWYETYYLQAQMASVVPIDGMSTTYFYPTWALLRGEAAAMINNALNPPSDEPEEDPSEQEQPSDTGDNDSDPTPEPEPEPEPTPTPGPVVVPVQFPFTENDRFRNKEPYSFTFTLDREETVSVDAELEHGESGGLTCRLYLLSANGFSSEYYLGYEEEESCYIKATLNPGSYQLQLQPTSPNTWFDVDVDLTNGDGNDGFTEARRVNVGQAITESLSENDYYDFFRINILHESDYIFDVSSDDVTCLIFPMEDVDLSSFDFPACNEEFRYATGTYYIAIGRKQNRDERVTYTVQLR